MPILRILLFWQVLFLFFGVFFFFWKNGTISEISCYLALEQRYQLIITKTVKFLCVVQSTGAKVQGHFSQNHAVLHFYLQHSVIQKLSIKTASFLMCTINSAAFTNHVEVPFNRIPAFSSGMTSFNFNLAKAKLAKTQKLKKTWFCIYTCENSYSFAMPG